MIMPSSNVVRDLNQMAESLPFMSIAEFGRGRPYRIQGARAINTKYGGKILVTVNNHELFLPSNFHALSQEGIDEMNSVPLCITYTGDELTKSGYERRIVKLSPRETTCPNQYSEFQNMPCKSDPVFIHPNLTASIHFDVDAYVNAAGRFPNGCCIVSQEIFDGQKIVTIKVASNDVHIVLVRFLVTRISPYDANTRYTVYLDHNKTASIDITVTASEYVPAGVCMRDIVIAPMYVPQLDAEFNPTFATFTSAASPFVERPPNSELLCTANNTSFNIIFMSTNS